MKKLFISQPMKGKSDEDILKERNKAIAEAERLCDDVVEVLDSFFQGAPADAKPLWFLGQIIRTISLKQMWRILRRDGQMREDAKLNICVLLSMVLIE